MKEHERKFLEDTVTHLATSIANNLREEYRTDEIIEDKNTLTDYGEMWVRGYLMGRLTLIRGCSTGNPNVSPDDITEIGRLVDEHEGRIASTVYS
ncbi:hypothetical protein [Halomicrococcus gelatinilyticus]|uniref:hypothetical protein n=1 Tax=Halomicrococcus gelatinilyticus TaxID=1702103 RepID=UPI002E116789